MRPRGFVESKESKINSQKWYNISESYFEEDEPVLVTANMYLR